ncbi:MAG: ABC transporter ATP-binding protein [Nitrososphaerales archaeon]|nr:ABC transporter ATP-binding protein [Nitrososphaerales archaeon]
MVELLRVENINAGYQSFQVLFDVNTTIERGKITVVVGPNGSGKSTFLKTICGLTTIYSGRIFYMNKEITGLSPHQLAKEGIAYLPQIGNVFLNLTVKENLIMSSYTLDKYTTQERIKEVTEYFPMIKAFWNRKAITLSGGERQILAMAMALVRRPKVMLFDEPTANLSPKMALQIFDEIIKLRDEYGITVVLVEQNARKALERGNRALLFVNGRIIFEGEPNELLNHSELSSLYLGVKS